MVPEDIRQLLRDAAPTVTDGPDFDVLWRRGRRQRRALRVLGSVGVVGVVGVLVAVVLVAGRLELPDVTGGIVGTPPAPEEPSGGDVVDPELTMSSTDPFLWSAMVWEAPVVGAEPGATWCIATAVGEDLHRSGATIDRCERLISAPEDGALLGVIGARPTDDRRGLIWGVVTGSDDVVVVFADGTEDVPMVAHGGRLPFRVWGFGYHDEPPSHVEVRRGTQTLDTRPLSDPTLPDEP